MSNFESFNEEQIPRFIPQRTVPQPLLDHTKVTVPEVSIILDDSIPLPSNSCTPPKSYKEWKNLQENQRQKHLQILNAPSKVNTVVTQNLLELGEKRKVVTFDLPNQMEVKSSRKSTPARIESAPIGAYSQPELNLCNAKTGNNNEVRSAFLGPCHMNAFGGNHTPTTHFNNSNMGMTTNGNITNLEELYRRLSIQQAAGKSFSTNQRPNEANLMTRSAPQSEVTLNDVYNLLQSLQQGPTPTNCEQLEFRRMNAMQNMPMNQIENVGPAMVNMNVAPSIDSEPTTKDLLKVILKQQEQLMNLQSHVHMLLMGSNNVVGPPAGFKHPELENNYTNQKILDSQPNSNNFSTNNKPFGVMTSLEINVQKRNSTKPQAIDEAKKRNVITTEPDRQVRECKCKCDCAPTEKMIVSSDTDSTDENCDSFSKNGEAQTGWTFYGNILNQVNNVLQNTSPVSSARSNEAQRIETTPNIGNRLDKSHPSPVDYNSNASPNFRCAQIKRVGFQIDDVNFSAMAKRVTFDSSPNSAQRKPADHQMTPTDKSMLMNVLAMKYLPCESNSNDSHVQNLMQNGVTQANLLNRTPTSTNVISPHRMIDSQPKNLNTDMSMNSYRYMEKYGLL